MIPKIQEPVIFLRSIYLDLPIEKREEEYKYFAIWNSLNVLAFYKPVIPYMTFALNCVRAIPSFKDTFEAVIDGKCPENTQMMKTAYYALIIGLTVINPLYGMLAANVDSLYRNTSEFYENFNKIQKINKVARGLNIFGSLSQLSLFFTPHPTAIFLTTASFGVASAISIYNRINNNAKNPNQTTYLDIAHFLLSSVVLYYRHQFAVNSISQVSNEALI